MFFEFERSKPCVYFLIISCVVVVVGTYINAMS